MAITIKNLPISAKSGAKEPSVKSVLHSEATKNQIINQGKVAEKEKLLFVALVLRLTQKAKTSVIGIIIKVRVSFTIVA